MALVAGGESATPAADGFRMPAEFEPHAGCWMIWPERLDNWRLGARPAQEAFAAVAAAIAQFEPVTVCTSATQYERARAALPPTVRVVEMSTNDAWIRDTGPTFVVPCMRSAVPVVDPMDHSGGGGGAGWGGGGGTTDGHAFAPNAVRGIHWKFNAWGGLYGDFGLDSLVAQKVLDMERCLRYRAPIVLEGGSIHVDGEGTALTTEECLLNPNRNPGWSKERLEAVLRAYLNVQVIIWLGRGVFNDETSGHIDNLCCFVRPGAVALTWCDDELDPMYDICRSALHRLESARDARGRTLQVYKLHQPGPLFMTEEEADGVIRLPGLQYERHAGNRLAGSYVNFYIANGGVVVPLLDERTDAAALEVLQRECFPDRRVVGVPAREILLGGGNIHCITQQQPL